MDVYELTGTIPAGEMRTAIIAYDVTLRQGSARWEAPVLEFQSLPQVGIQSKAAPIVAEAERIARERAARMRMPSSRSQPPIYRTRRARAAAGTSPR